MTTTSLTTSTNVAGASVLSGVVSGLNTSALVAAQMASESGPRDALQAQVTTDNTLLASLQKLNTSYAKSSIEGYLTELNKLGEMYSDFAKQTYAPAQAAATKAAETVKSNVSKATAAAAA